LFQGEVGMGIFKKPDGGIIVVNFDGRLSKIKTSESIARVTSWDLVSALG
jgi:alpha-acetolactate decarboxylase